MTFDEFPGMRVLRVPLVVRLASIPARGFRRPFTSVVLLPGVCFTRENPESLSRTHLRHEYEHVKQWGRYGITLPFRYVLEFLRHGYRDNRFEREAREAAGQE